MSTQQQKSELLATGYVKRTYNNCTIPFPLVKLMQLFYDDWIHWILKDAKFKQFTNAKVKEVIICSKSFKIEGIEFEMFSIPNLCSKDKLSGVMIGLAIKYLPSNIESFAYHLKIKCQQMNCLIKRFCAVKKGKGAVFGTIICRLSELKDLKYICFNYLINIKNIKYKKECNKINYFSAINKIQKCSKFNWFINGLLFEKCKKMIFQQPVYSDNFDNNNWCAILWPNGFREIGKSDFMLQCLHFPPNTNSMDVKIKYDINGQIMEHMVNLNHGRHCSGTNGMPFDEFIKQKACSISVSLEIINFYDENDEIIEESKYEQYGIVINK